MENSFSSDSSTPSLNSTHKQPRYIFSDPWKNVNKKNQNEPTQNHQPDKSVPRIIVNYVHTDISYNKNSTSPDYGNSIIMQVDNNAQTNSYGCNNKENKMNRAIRNQPQVYKQSNNKRNDEMKEKLDSVIQTNLINSPLAKTARVLNELNFTNPENCITKNETVCGFNTNDAWQQSDDNASAEQGNQDEVCLLVFSIKLFI